MNIDLFDIGLGVIILICFIVIIAIGSANSYPTSNAYNATQIYELRQDIHKLSTALAEHEGR